MAKTPLCSAKEVLAKVIRNTGNKLPSVYFDDVLEWIPEGIDMLSTTKTLETASTPACGEGGSLKVVNYQVCLPKGLLAVLAVEDRHGMRVPEGGDVTDLSKPTTAYHTGSDNSQSAVSRASVFEVNPLDHQTEGGVPTTKPGSSIPIFGEDIKQVNLSQRLACYYKISGSYLQTSFEQGFIRIHYLKRPLDKDGYPMIPDNENFKTSLAWYVIMMLIGAGYQHPVFKFVDAQAQFELYGARAIGEISYPSLDATARVNRSFIRLIPPYHLQDDFFINSEQTQYLRK